MTISAVILVVDDDPAIRESLQRELRQRDYTTVLASDGIEGVRAFDTHAPDLVMADL
ncbi:MAG: response regulator, partial [Thermoanaerobaculia bacterium]